MSDLVVQPIEIQAIKPHPNADRLEIAVVGGWNVIVGKDNHSVGDVMVHVQPDSMVPKPWADEWGVSPYLSWRGLVDDSTLGRVRAARLRGVVSFGFLVPNESGADLGTDLSEHYGIRKYDPPQILGAGMLRQQHPLFHNYTNIQNLRNNQARLCYGEPLVVTEKIHGTNSRIGCVRQGETLEAILPGMTSFMNPNTPFELVVGTHRTQRVPDDCGIYGLPIQLHGDQMTNIVDWLEKAYSKHPEPKRVNSVIFFGEIFGAGVQDLHYGAKQEKGYRLFDISVNGQYLPWTTLEWLSEQYGLPLVPVITRGVFDFEQLLELAEGNTRLDDTHIREGIVIRPLGRELTWGKGTLDPNPRRMIFKLLSGAYLARKGGSEYH